MIADFLSDDDERIEARKKQITDEEWVRAEKMGAEYIRLYPGVARDGRPV